MDCRPLSAKLNRLHRFSSQGAEFFLLLDGGLFIWHSLGSFLKFRLTLNSYTSQVRSPGFWYQTWIQVEFLHPVSWTGYGSFGISHARQPLPSLLLFGDRILLRLILNSFSSPGKVFNLLHILCVLLRESFTVCLSSCTSLAGLELTEVFLHLPSEYWNWKCVPPCLVFKYFFC